MTPSLENRTEKIHFNYLVGQEEQVRFWRAIRSGKLQEAELSSQEACICEAFFGRYFEYPLGLQVPLSYRGTFGVAYGRVVLTDMTSITAFMNNLGVDKPADLEGKTVTTYLHGEVSLKNIMHRPTVALSALPPEKIVAGASLVREIERSSEEGL
jgi:hypothetical protein